MSSFQKDVQLLTDLQELISDAERTANMPGYAGAVFNAISPALKAAMPAAQKKARRQIDVLTRAKKRLMELMEEPQKGPTVTLSAPCRMQTSGRTSPSCSVNSSSGSRRAVVEAGNIASTASRTG